jgi:hypothetical protein
MQRHNLLGRLTTPNGRNLILAMLLFSACRTLVAQQTLYEVFKVEHIVYDTLTKEKKYTLSLINNYVLRVSNYRDSLFLIPYKITATENSNYYCFDFPYGNPKWDYKNMTLRKKQITNLASIKKQKELLDAVQLNNEAFYKRMLNTSDTSQKSLFAFGLFLKEGVKKIEIIGENKIIFKVSEKVK